MAAARAPRARAQNPAYRPTRPSPVTVISAGLQMPPRGPATPLDGCQTLVAQRFQTPHPGVEPRGEGVGGPVPPAHRFAVPLERAIADVHNDFRPLWAVEDPT